MLKKLRSYLVCIYLFVQFYYFIIYNENKVFRSQTLPPHLVKTYPRQCRARRLRTCRLTSCFRRPQSSLWRTLALWPSPRVRRRSPGSSLTNPSISQTNRFVAITTTKDDYLCSTTKCTTKQCYFRFIIMLLLQIKCRVRAVHNLTHSVMEMK